MCCERMGTPALHSVRKTCSRAEVRGDARGRCRGACGATNGVGRVVRRVQHDGRQGVLAVTRAIGEHLHGHWALTHEKHANAQHTNANERRTSVSSSWALSPK